MIIKGQTRSTKYYTERRTQHKPGVIVGVPRKCKQYLLHVWHQRVSLVTNQVISQIYLREVLNIISCHVVDLVVLL